MANRFTNGRSKTAEPIAMLFGLSTQMGPRKHVLWGIQIPMQRGNFYGKGHARACLTTFVSCAKMAEPIDMPFGSWTCVHGSRSPCKKAIFRERKCLDMPEDTLSWAVQKWLNRSRCRLGCGLGWTQGSMCYMGVHWRNLANTTEPTEFGWAEWSSRDVALCEITL